MLKFLAPILIFIALIDISSAATRRRNPHQPGRKTPIRTYQNPSEEYYWVFYPYNTMNNNNYSPLSDKHQKISRISDATREALSLTKKCDGKQNLVDDFALISFIIGTLSTFVGFGLDLIVTFSGNTIAIISMILGLLVGIPNAIISLLAVQGPFAYWLANGLNVLGFSIVFYGASSYEIGNLGLLVDIVFEIVGFVGFIMSIFSTWPHLIDETLLLGDYVGYGEEFKYYLDSYGCSLPPALKLR